MTPIYFHQYKIFLCLSKVWNIIHHRLVRQVHKNSYLMLLYTCIFFFIMKFEFLSFSFLFFDEISNFWNKIWSNQKRGLVVSNCQWNCNVSIVLLLDVLKNHRPPTGIDSWQLTTYSLTRPPPTHQEVLHQLTNHWPSAYWQVLCQSTNPSTYWPTKHQPLTHQLS